MHSLKVPTPPRHIFISQGNPASDKPPPAEGRRVRPTLFGLVLSRNGLCEVRRAGVVSALGERTGCENAQPVCKGERVGVRGSGWEFSPHAAELGLQMN
jgi:hypothetical protein